MTRDPDPSTTPPHATTPDLDRALDLVRFLRANCSWDREQTPGSLVPYLLEETHEVVDAIQDGDWHALEGELGDLLLNLAFQVVLGEERGRFSAASVATRLQAKMERRHPHLYGSGEARDWASLKAEERPEAGVLGGLKPGLDPLSAAHRIQDRVSRVGFDWSDFRGAWEKVAEELEEVRAALEEGERVPAGVGAEAGEAGRTAGGAEPPSPLDEELGDLLFAAVNLVRLAGRHPTPLLAQANRKFRRRFERLETLARERGVVIEEAGLEALDRLWDEVKAGEPHRS